LGKTAQLDWLVLETVSDFRPSPFNWVDRLTPVTKSAVLRAFRPFHQSNAFDVGDLPTGLFRVVAGRVDMISITPDGRRVLINTYFPGESFGELTIIDGGLNNAAASRLSNARLGFIPPRDAQRLRREQPEFDRALILAICNTSRTLLSSHIQNLTLNAGDRVCNALAMFCGRLGQDDDGWTLLAITQDELADHTGLSRRSVVGVLEKMDREGTLERGYGSFRINAAALAQRAARPGLEFGSL